MQEPGMCALAKVKLRGKSFGCMVSHRVRRNNLSGNGKLEFG